MSSVEEIESALAKLTLGEKQVVLDWLEDLIEDQMEVSDRFKSKIARAEQEIAEGVHSRVRKPMPTSESCNPDLFARFRF